ncbi:hypothetical protein QUF61_11775 [Candidatus Venteria ishoeyi]|uniref:hypothetical protein n=1 Tax=Candidatus Venteria ishoeyi TaxID=1899563 RepID=UPI0025A6493F|nr:hypothetical protein [Candidatus Venteria ishoeyi]MDM8547164.1 hypothetical protein [Candidatus Venteria ishoeyi]
MIFIELKRGKTDLETNIIQQLKGAQCVMAYCRSIGQIFWKENDFLDPDKYDCRFISIRNISINKKPSFTQNKPGQLHSSPENMLKISSPHNLYFKRLVGAI